MRFNVKKGAVIRCHLINGSVFSGKLVGITEESVRLKRQLRYKDNTTIDVVGDVITIRRESILAWDYARPETFKLYIEDDFFSPWSPRVDMENPNLFNQDGFCKGTGSWAGSVREADKMEYYKSCQAYKSSNEGGQDLW